MKWISVLSLCAAGLAFNACEKHRASELEDAHGAGEGHPSAAGHAPAAHGPAHDARPTEGAAKPSEAPKFFPEKK